MVHISGRQNLYFCDPKVLADIGKVGDCNDQMTKWVAVIFVDRGIQRRKVYVLYFFTLFGILVQFDGIHAASEKGMPRL